MGSVTTEHGDALLWDIAGPRRPLRVPGVTMAGFGDRGLTPARLRLIPHPAVTVLFVLGDPFTLEDPAGRRHRGSFVIGAGFGDVLHGPDVRAPDCLQMRLAPTLAQAVLGPAVADLNDAVVTLDELLGPEATRISEQLNVFRSWDERFAWAEHWVAGRAALAPVYPEITWAWQRLVTGHGTPRIEDLAAELGWSRKRLWSRFNSQLGLPPKRAAKLIRFDHAVHRLVAGHAPAAVAAESGYVDQSHLHRDVMSFTGTTPATVIDEPFLAVDHLAWGSPARPRPATAVRAKGNR
ncbi:AraC family transcriptional regulator [Nocardia heshunensis]